MTVEILSVGTELLLGNIVNTNAAFIAEALAKLGITTYHQSTVGDNHERLVAAIAHAFETADMIIAIGGLGPTLDDITKAATAEYFGVGLTTHEETLRLIEARSAGRFSENIERNAIVPEGCSILPNDHGQAPGVIMEKNGKIAMLLPGPPHELEPMFTHYAVPFLREKTSSVFYSRTLKIMGIGEAKVEVMLQDLIEAQTNPTIAPYAKVGEVHIRLTASAESEGVAQNLIEPIAKEIYHRLSPNIYGEDEKSLAETVLDLLKANNHTIAIAESCTGGLIVSDLIAVSGCSEVLREGLIAYSNEAKTARLKVPELIIKTYGAVSPQTAIAMAEGAARTSNASVAISTTGIAGPDGGTSEKPVGLVYIGLYIEGRETQVLTYNFASSRNIIRTRAAKFAMDGLRRALQEKNISIKI
ncbi:MAG: competence/damage-inducible protein A [Defluviitaleaceae bacterium]|nr:competence/damage-inducible protein A [Defluviitaleaceae bacterium]